MEHWGVNTRSYISHLTDSQQEPEFFIITLLKSVNIYNLFVYSRKDELQYTEVSVN